MENFIRLGPDSMTGMTVSGFIFFAVVSGGFDQAEDKQMCDPRYTVRLEEPES